ncbi:hypothetical protein CC53_gp104 [Rhizobium phage vB_RleS_L338C]|uniref:hypothetical protein n=1 Tax=Rhizobium phage vB_RleS_L338C TaxID=1414737 RepID=UPI0003D8846B|nr:hypothetical protein CC53_gp104 [Rhizobium phage vB_RleS_L338C]AHC30521.1 hypothetical protein L338C_104 [Rhizobium phage vB_RleS_L338C]QNH72168.1 hypothetical protein P11VFA_046 [Rhizobium phage P11VFA]
MAEKHSNLIDRRATQEAKVGICQLAGKQWVELLDPATKAPYRFADKKTCMKTVTRLVLKGTHNIMPFNASTGELLG